MKTVLIIYSHWHPVNLAGVHRPRLIGNFLSELGWRTRILTVDSFFYEEKLDPDFYLTFSADFTVTYTKAFPIIKPRLIGDIGIRAFYFLYKKAKQIINEEKIDFIWIPIPSFYQAILGRMLFEKTGVPYGIDYIDPWIRNLKGNRSIRAKFSNLIARALEPYAVKKVSLISGVSKSYYQPVLDRNFKDKSIENIGMPYGFDPNDHKIKLNSVNYPWKNKKIKPILYAGAFLPQSGLFIDSLFKAVKELRLVGKWDMSIHFYFIGTGNYKHKSIQSYSKDVGVDDIVTEIRDRKPYLNILNYLNNTWRVMIIGNTEKHYTASKTFQAILSQKPIFSMFHKASSAAKIMREVNADTFTFRFEDKMKEVDIIKKIKPILINFISNNTDWEPDLKKLDKYSAKNSAQLLVEKLNKIVNMNNNSHN